MSTWNLFIVFMLGVIAGLLWKVCEKLDLIVYLLEASQ